MINISDTLSYALFQYRICVELRYMIASYFVTPVHAFNLLDAFECKNNLKYGNFKYIDTSNINLCDFLNNEITKNSLHCKVIDVMLELIDNISDNNINILDENGNNLIHLIVYNFNIVRYGISFSGKIYNGEYIININTLISKISIRMTDKVLNNINKYGYSVLHHLCKNYSYSQTMIINIIDRLTNETINCLIVEKNESALMYASINSLSDVVIKLLKSMSDEQVNQCNDLGWNALFFACCGVNINYNHIYSIIERTNADPIAIQYQNTIEQTNALIKCCQTYKIDIFLKLFDKFTYSTQIYNIIYRSTTNTDILNKIIDKIDVELPTNDDVLVKLISYKSQVAVDIILHKMTKNKLNQIETHYSILECLITITFDENTIIYFISMLSDKHINKNCRNNTYLILVCEKKMQNVAICLIQRMNKDLVHYKNPNNSVTALKVAKLNKLNEVIKHINDKK